MASLELGEENEVRYTLHGAAFLLELNPRQVRRWSEGYTEMRRGHAHFRKGVLTRHRDPDEPVLFNFYELIELLWVKKLIQPRDGQKALTTLDGVRRIVEALAPTLGRYPLASARFKSVGSQLVTESEVDGQLVNILKQQRLAAFADEIAEVVKFDADGLANALFLNKNHTIRIERNVRFGQPILASNIPADLVYRRYLADGGDVPGTAQWFRISESEVMDAVRFGEERLSESAA